ncbi:MAG: IS30 family transposase [Herminiimonas sp.]|nr:IS30 family transposase [Herminiimonas sp.]
MTPHQIAAMLKAMWPDGSSKTVSHDTIYDALYLHSRGELKQEMLACLRHHNQVRKPRRRGSNENTNSLLRQYMPKGSDLSVYSQDELDEIALSLNTRPRQSLGFRTPLAVYTEHTHRQQLQPDSLH